MQLDKVVSPPGVFASARTYSVVRDDAGLYLIFTGKAMGARTGSGVAGAIADGILDKMADKRAVAINQVEAKLREVGPVAMQGTKHSCFIPKAAIKKLTFKGGDPPSGWPVVAIQADKKFKLHFYEYDAAAVRELFEPFIPAG